MTSQYRYKSVRAYIAEMVTAVACVTGVIWFGVVYELYAAVFFVGVGIVYTFGWLCAKLPERVGRFVDRRWPPKAKPLEDYPDDWNRQPSHARTLPTLQIVDTPEPETKE